MTRVKLDTFTSQTLINRKHLQSKIEIDAKQSKEKPNDHKNCNGIKLLAHYISIFSFRYGAVADFLIPNKPSGAP